MINEEKLVTAILSQAVEDRQQPTPKVSVSDKVATTPFSIPLTSVSPTFRQLSEEDRNKLLGDAHTRWSPEKPEEVQVGRASDVLEARAAAQNAFTSLFVGLGAVALLVGGIGIANVMVISVIERKNEIFKALYLSKPKNLPAVIVIPDLLTPGINAKT